MALIRGDIQRRIVALFVKLTKTKKKSLFQRVKKSFRRKSTILTKYSICLLPELNRVVNQYLAKCWELLGCRKLLETIIR